MAKYKLEYACGHVVEQQLYGKVVDRERYATAMKYKLCPDCKKEEYMRDGKRIIENSPDLPQLIGSEKQIAWAAKIRQEALEEIEEMKDELFKRPAINPELQEAIVKWIDKIRNQTQATWWIERRNVTWNQEMREDKELIAEVKRIEGQKGG